MYRLVTKKLSGKVRVSSQPGQGAIFILELPATAPEMLFGDEIMAAQAGQASPESMNSGVTADVEMSPLHLRDELLDIRSLVESNAAAAAARHVSDIDRKRLTEAFKRLDKSFTGLDGETQVASDLAFHMTIIDLSGDPALQKVGAAVIPLMYGHVRRNLARLMPDPDRREILRRQHRAIYEAIVAGNPDIASAAASEHMAYVRTFSGQLDENAGG